MKLRRVLLLAVVAVGVATAGLVSAQVPPTGSAVNGWLQAIFNQLSDGSGSGGPRTQITASSGNVAAATATATLAAVAGKTTFICGFQATAGGATAAAVVTGTITNIITGTMSWTYGANTGAGVPTAPLVVPFNPCVPANAVNTTIVVSMPSLGAGNTNATVSAWGYQR